LLSNLIEVIKLKKIKNEYWKFSASYMAEICSVCEGAIRRAIKGLVLKGYLKVIRYQNEVNGQFLGTDYLVSEIAEFAIDNKKLEGKKTYGNF